MDESFLRELAITTIAFGFCRFVLIFFSIVYRTLSNSVHAGLGSFPWILDHPSNGASLACKPFPWSRIHRSFFAGSIIVSNGFIRRLRSEASAGFDDSETSSSRGPWVMKFPALRAPWRSQEWL